MAHPPPFTGSVWFATVLGLLVSLGAQVLIGAAIPMATFNWLHGEHQPASVILVAGETSYWLEDSVIRVVSFGIGALFACLLARSPSWLMLGSLTVTALLATTFAQFPMPATPWQLAVWTSAAPGGASLVGIFFRLRKGASALNY